MASYSGHGHEYEHVEPAIEIAELGVLPVEDDYLVIANRETPGQWIEGHAIDLMDHR